MNFEWKLNTIERRQKRQSIMYANTHSHTHYRSLLQIFCIQITGPRCSNKKRVILSLYKYFYLMKKKKPETHQPFIQHHQSTLNYKSNSNNNNRGISSKSVFSSLFSNWRVSLKQKKNGYTGHIRCDKRHTICCLWCMIQKKEVCH